MPPGLASTSKFLARSNKSRRGCASDCDGRHGAASRDDDCDPPADQIGCQLWQPIELALSPAVLDRDVLAFGIARILQAPAKCTQAFREPVGRYGAEETDYWHRRLLRPCRQRPRGRRAAE